MPVIRSRVRQILAVGIAMTLTASAPSTAQQVRAKPDLFAGATDWLNTAKPIASTDLLGKIVILDFWTYCCINCHHLIPDLERIEQKYPNEVVVIGVHSPKFEGEKDSANIRQKIREYRIKHPVANDADMALWNNFGANGWPTVVVLDVDNQPARAPDGRLAVAYGESALKKLEPLIDSLVAARKAAKQINETPFVVYAESDRPSDGPLLYPGKVLADPAGNRLFISDTGHDRIVVTDLEGHKLEVIGSGDRGLKDGGYEVAAFHRPQGMALLGETLYVADTENHALRRIDLAGRQVGTVAGDGTLSYDDPRDGPAKETRLNSPWDVLPIDDGRRLAIAMAGTHQIWSYDVAADTVSWLAGSGREDILDGPPRRAAFAQSSGLATDGEQLFVADSEGSAIRAVDLGRNREVRTLVNQHDLPQGRSLFSFGDADGRGDRARLQHCLGVAYADGILYIADTYNNKIKACDVATRTVKTLGGTREPGSSDGAPSFYQPGGLSVAGSNLYIADTNNHLIRVLDLETNAVRTLELKEVDAPATQRRPPAFRDATLIEAPAAEVAPGRSFTIQLKIDVPGFKLAADTPTLYLLEADRPDAFAPSVSPTGTRVVPEGDSLPIPVELARPPAAGQTIELKLSASLFVCSETNGFCTLKNYIWTLPITFKPGAGNRIDLTTAVDAPAPAP